MVSNSQTSGGMNGQIRARPVSAVACSTRPKNEMSSAARFSLPFSRASALDCLTSRSATS